MRPFIYIFSTLLLTICLNNTLNAQTWAPQADLPEAREGALCFSINDKVYWGGGTPSSQTKVVSSFYEYDPATNKWTQKANLPQPLGFGASFAINGKGYIAMGRNTNSGGQGVLATTYEYDPATDSWTQKADVNPNNFGYYRVSSFVVNNKAYVIGGYNGGLNPHGKMFEYDPANDSWSEKAEYPVTAQLANYVILPLTFSINGKGYITCGEVRKSSGAGTEFTKKTFEYDPANDSWTPKADYPGDARAAGIGFSKDGKGYAGLGFNKDPNFNTLFHSDIYVYDPQSDSWTKGNDLPGQSRVFASVAATSNNVFAGGGAQFGTAHVKDWYSFQFTSSISSNINTDKTAIIYPNPASGFVHIKSDKQFDNYSLYSIDGRHIKGGTLDNSTINVTEVPSGQYIIQLQSDSYTHKGFLSIGR